MVGFSLTWRTLRSIQEKVAVGRGRLRAARWITLERRHRIDVVCSLVSACLASGLAVIALEMWRADFSVPFRYTGDANFNAMLIKGTLEHGWWFVNNNLGAPYGQQLYDFAAGSVNLDLGLIRLLGLVVPNYVVVMNVFFLLTFPLSALSAYVVLRWARLSALVACTCSVLFALTPYHFQRGEGHLFLAADFAVPLGAYLVLGVAGGRPMFARRPGRRGLAALLSKRTLLTVGAGVVVASAGDGFYYAAFTMILVAIAGAIRAVAALSPRSAATGATIASLVLFVCVVNLAPTIAYAAVHGRNYVVASRNPSESEVYSLKFAQLVLPRNDHRISAFAQLKALYASTAQPRAPSEVYDASLGTLGAAGFVWLLAVLAASALGFRRGVPRVVLESRPAAVAAATAYLVGTTGGISALFAYLISPQIRAWNRISIFIAFFSLLGLGLLLECARRRMRPGAGQRWLFVVGLAVVIAIGLADQTAGSDVPRYASLAKRYRTDGSFVRRIESTLPLGASVFELPYQPFPEGPPVNGVNRYDPVRPYLHSTRLRWSYGAMEGRAEDWQSSLAERPLPEIVTGVAAAGFSGIYVDLAGYPHQARKLEQLLDRVLQARPLESADQRFIFYDLRPYEVRLRAECGQKAIARLRAATLTPPRVEPGSGVALRQYRNSKGQQSWFVTSNRATFDLYEPSGTETVFFLATLRFGQTTGPHRFAHVKLTWPDGSGTSLRIGTAGTSIRRRLRLKQGDNLVRVRTDIHSINVPGTDRTLRLQLLDSRFTFQSFVP